jgi:hypothetical protein
MNAFKTKKNKKKNLESRIWNEQLKTDKVKKAKFRFNKKN